MLSSTALVQSSWQQVLPIRALAAELFYAKLFELDPSLKSLFKGDMKEQGNRLMTMIGVAVVNLDRPEILMPALRGLGARHGGYGVKDRHYDTVASALLDTLQRGLGDAFTPEVKAAWTEVYRIVADAMKSAAGNVAEDPTLSD
ncbi:hemoglobin-like flavoprotein [Acidovorax sp. 69]|uniref:globin family protein n=1 Tax=Acidovorax sp. 69 TaxID=2035202 RepID=UPI000C2493B3|nr:globin family protein [Acidovorax sp. 69]PJI99432.1 hemoglobin-like flavoprotein [Acidovorax sp. 69]